MKLWAASISSHKSKVRVEGGTVLTHMFIVAYATKTDDGWSTQWTLVRSFGYLLPSSQPPGTVQPNKRAG